MIITNLKPFTHIINKVCASDEYAELLKDTKAILQSLEPQEYTDVMINPNIVVHDGNRFIGYLNKVIYHHFPHRLTPVLLNFYVQGNGISYAKSDLALASLGSLAYAQSKKTLSITERASIAHFLLDGIVEMYMEENK